jgi:Flp pilus assembly protein TadG
MKQHPKHRSAFKHLLRDERGIVAIYMAVCLPVFVGLLILVVDGSHALSTRHMLQVTADSAALAAASDPNSSSLYTTANTYAQMNMPVNTYGTVLASNDVKAVYWPSGICATTTSCDQTCSTAPTSLTPCNAVKVTTRYMPNLFFAQALRWTGLNASATAIATFGYGTGASLPAWDAVIAQDITASFKNSIKNAQDADKALLNCMQTNASSSSQLGLSMFTSVSLNRPVLTPAIDPKTGQSDVTLTNDISSFGDCSTSGMPACSGTNIAAGITAGVAQFTSSAYKGSVTSGSKQNIIVVTDGQPNSCGQSSCNSGQTPASIATTAANTAAANNIDVSTIYFCSSGCSNSDQTYLASLKRGHGFSLVAPTKDDIAKAMLTVCQNSQGLITRLVW